MKLIWIGAYFSITLIFGHALFSIILFVSTLGWVFFSLIQSLVVIDLLYLMSTKLKERIEVGGGKLFQITNYLLMVLTYSVSVWMNVVSYKSWAVPKWIPIFNSVFIGLFLVTALLGGSKSNTVLLSGMVVTYLQIVTYQTSKAMTIDVSHPSIWLLASWALLLLLTFVGMLSKGSGRIKTGASSINQKL